MNPPSKGQLLAQVPVTNTQGLIYACPSIPANAYVEVTSMWICNTDSASVLLTLLYNRGTLTPVHSLFHLSPIEPNRTYIIFDGAPVKMTPGFKFDAYASITGKIIISVWGDVWLG